jgi:enoyl-CoA hydratase/carnithine racemase
MVLIRSSNEKAFCSGVDILGLTLPEALASVLCAAKVNLLHSHSERSKKYREDPTIAHKLPREMNLYYLDYLVHRLKELKIPHVALMDGITMGGVSRAKCCVGVLLEEP